MDVKSFGVVSFALAVTPALGAQAAPAREPAVPVAKSYSELLEPIPNASERLKLADLQDRYAPAHLIRARWEGREHHHHHHHHHHNNSYYYGYSPYYSPYSGYYPSYYASPYYSQPYGYTTYYGGAYYRGYVRRNHHHHHHHHHHRDRD